jgi:uncharacterized protein (TIGR00369 family)
MSSAMTSPEPQNPDFAAEVRRSILGMPVAGLFGIDFGVIEAGRVEVLLPFRTELGYRANHFQGTVVAAVAYFSGTSALATLLSGDHVGMTLDQSVKFIAPATGERLIGRGRVISAGRSVSVGAADVFAVRHGRETLCATALVTTRNMPRARMKG